MDLCNKISFALVSSCDTLVNPDNTLTSAGTHARDCIQNGALLAGGALLVGPSPNAIILGLPIAAQLFGCDNIVDFTKLTLGQLKGLGQIFKYHNLEHTYYEYQTTMIAFFSIIITMMTIATTYYIVDHWKN
jgi:hypothetical protein